LEDISKGIKGLGSLRELRLEIYECKKITDIGLISLSKSLAELVFLEDITIDLVK